MKKFCVIHPMVDAQRVRRSWKDTEAEAVAHATRLMESNYAKGQKTSHLFVVQVVKVVAAPPAVTVVVRDPDDGDIARDVEDED